MHRTAALSIAILTAVSCGSGCTTRPYEQDYQQRVADFRGAAVFAPLAQDPTELANGRVALRLPSALEPIEVDDRTGARARPPFVRQFPGFVAAYEKVVVMPGNMQAPVVFTIGAVPVAEQRFSEVESAILEQVRRDESFPKVDWERGRSVEPMAGGPAMWDVLSLSGPQEFDSKPTGEPEIKRWPGRCEIWVSADPKQEVCTVLALRAPDDVADQLPVTVTELIELAARTVQPVAAAAVEQPADAPAK
jgi:DNA-binding transcriptional regulator YdaS (Cro superfamily)